MYKSAGKLYAFPNAKTGQTEQWELDTSGPTIAGTRVRAPWDVGGAVEGCVAGDATKRLYISEESVGIWEYGAEPTDSTSSRVQVDKTGTGGHLTADVEGLAIAGNFLIASSQGDDSFTTYDKTTRAFIRKLKVVAGTSADGCENTDGIDAVSGSLNATFAQGRSYVTTARTAHRAHRGTRTSRTSSSRRSSMWAPRPRGVRRRRTSRRRRRADRRR